MLIASAIAPVVAPPPPVTPVTGQGSHVHLDIQHSPPTSPSHSPRIEASTSHHTGPVHATPPVTSVTPQVGGNSDRSHIQESFHGHSSSHNTAHDPSHEFVQGSSNPPKKRKLLDDFESTYHEHLKTITPAQNAEDASIESRYYVKFQLIVLFYIDGRDSQKGFGPDAERKRCKY